SDGESGERFLGGRHGRLLARRHDSSTRRHQRVSVWPIDYRRGRNASIDVGGGDWTTENTRSPLPMSGAMATVLSQRRRTDDALVTESTDTGCFSRSNIACLAAC